MKIYALLVGMLVVLSNPQFSTGAPLKLNFELPGGTPIGAPLLDYYDTAAGGNLGVTISSGGLYTCLNLPGVDSGCFTSRGGLGDPASQTGGMVTIANEVTLNFDRAFTGPMSLYYSLLENRGPASASVYSALNGTGTLLGAIDLPANLTIPNTRCGPGDGFCPFFPAELLFTGEGRSIVLRAPLQYIVYDDIAVNIADPVSPVPEPSTWTTMAGAAALAVMGMRRRANR